MPLSLAQPRPALTRSIAPPPHHAPSRAPRFLDDNDDTICFFGRVCRSAERRQILTDAGIRTYGTKRGKYRKLIISRDAELRDDQIQDLMCLLQGKPNAAKSRAPRIRNRVQCGRIRELLEFIAKCLRSFELSRSHLDECKPVCISELLEDNDEAIQFFGRICRSAERRQILTDAGMRTHGTKRGKYRKLMIERNANLTEARIDTLINLIQGKSGLEDYLFDSGPSSMSQQTSRDLEGAALLCALSQGNFASTAPTEAPLQRKRPAPPSWMPGPVQQGDSQVPGMREAHVVGRAGERGARVDMYGVPFDGRPIAMPPHHAPGGVKRARHAQESMHGAKMAPPGQHLLPMGTHDLGYRERRGPTGVKAEDAPALPDGHPPQRGTPQEQGDVYLGGMAYHRGAYPDVAKLEEGISATGPGSPVRAPPAHHYAEVSAHGGVDPQDARRMLPEQAAARGPVQGAAHPLGLHGGEMPQQQQGDAAARDRKGEYLVANADGPKPGVGPPGMRDSAMGQMLRAHHPNGAAINVMAGRGHDVMQMPPAADLRGWMPPPGHQEAMAARVPYGAWQPNGAAPSAQFSLMRASAFAGQRQDGAYAAFSAFPRGFPAAPVAPVAAAPGGRLAPVPAPHHGAEG